MEITLTPEQEKTIVPVWMAKYQQIGIGTGPCPDRPKAEDLIRQAYTVSGHKVAKKDGERQALASYHWHPSPKSMIAHVQEMLNTWTDKDGNKVKTPRGTTGDWTIDEAWRNVSLCYGSQDSNWLGYYAMVRGEKLKPDSETNELVPFIELAELVGWFATYDENVFICERADTLTVDEAGELHNETGPAMAFSDGLRLFAWHGYPIPEAYEYIIEKPETLTVETINKEQNLELKRIMIEKFGEKAYLEANEAVTVLEGDWATVLDFKVPNTTAELRYIKVIDGTPLPGTEAEFEVYYMEVRKDCAPLYENGVIGKEQEVKDDKAHVASTFGLTRDEYHPLIET